jgi:hypothetical protein
MYRLAASIFLFANSALAHDGHGAPAVHLHWWEYALLAAAIAGATIYCANRK